MTYTLRPSCEGIDWARAARVFELAPLGARDPERLRRAFLASHTVCFAFHGETLVGLGRALSDGEFQAAIYDLCIVPEHQGKGLGRAMLDDIIQRAGAEHVILYAVPGKEGFYRGRGFARMLTAMSLSRDPQRLRDGGYIEP